MSILRYVCHQRPDRSFFIRGKQFPLCSRCTGFYFSLIAGFIIRIFYLDFLSAFQLLLILCISTAPMAVDGLTQLVGVRESNNLIRLITGALCGFWTGVSICHLLEKFFYPP